MNKHGRSFLMLAAVAALWLSTVAFPAAQKQLQAEVALKAAMDKEIVDGDLNGAIAQYKKIIEKYSSNRAVAAKALIHMGQCYEKLGAAQTQEARKMYERIVQQYPEQKDLVAQALTRLAALAPPNPAGSPMASARRLWVGQYQSGAYQQNGPTSVSPDGRYLAQSDAGNIILIDVATGQTRRLTDDAAGQEDNIRPMFSPDGQRIAYLRRRAAGWEIRIMGLDASTPRVIYRCPQGGLDGMAGLGPFALAWSPDGRSVISFAPGEVVLLISAEDDSTRVILQAPRGALGYALSPDSRYLVYTTEPEKPHGFGWDTLLRIVPVGAGVPADAGVPLAEDGSQDRAPVWTSDGTSVLFLGNRNGIGGLWRVRVKDGRPVGSPELLKAGLDQVKSIGVTHDGAYLYSTQVDKPSARIVTVDRATSRITGQPVTVNLPINPAQAAADWAPDGQSFVYQYGSSSDNQVIAIHSLVDGRTRSLAPGMELIWQVRWSLDGRTILMSGRQKIARTVDIIFSVDPVTGAATQMWSVGERASVFRNGLSGWSADGKAMYELLVEAVDRRANVSFDQYRLLLHDLASGAETDVLKVNRPQQLLGAAPSRDGSLIGFVVTDLDAHNTSLRVMPAGGGEPRTLVTAQQPDTLGGAFDWTADNKAVLCIKVSQGKNGPTGELWRFPADGAAPTSTGLAMDRLTFPKLSPDGTQLLFNGGDFKAEVWMLENFLPKPAAASRGKAK